MKNKIVNVATKVLLASAIISNVYLTPVFAGTTKAESTAATSTANTVNEITKNLSLDLTNNYKECTFSITFEDDNFEADKIILTSPKGKEHDFSIDSVSSDQYTCKVNDVTAGTWSATIYKNFPDESDSFKIPKATFSAKTSETESSDVTGDISIAKEITGLKYYWRDNDIVVEWSDESVGNVVVKVINSKTLQVLDNKTVKEKSYSYTVDSSVDEIMLNIVPSTSSGIKGADTQYIVKNNYDPDATITFNDSEYTNQSKLSAEADINGDYTLVYYDNGNKVGEYTDLTNGKNDVEVPLTEGRNELLVYVVDKNGNMKSFSKNIIMDTVPPVLKVTEDINGTQTYDNTISISGNVSDFETLAHGTRSITVDDLGDFETSIDLKEGDNTVTLTATDIAGNVTEYNASVTMLVKEPLNIPIVPIIIGIAIAIIVVIIFLFKRNHPKKPMKDKKRKKEDDNDKENKQDEIINKTDVIQIASIIVTFAVAIFLIVFVFRITRVQSGSMEPTVMTGDVGVVNQLAYIKNSPQRGDIVIIDSKEKGVMLLKRIIGISGDKIEFHNGYVYINGTICDESAYLSSDVETNCSSTFEVPENCYFLMGDNRENSNDSRYWEQPYISKDDIVGELLINSDAVTIIEDFIKDIK